MQRQQISASLAQVKSFSMTVANENSQATVPNQQ
jgi:hypothetical protein